MLRLLAGMGLLLALTASPSRASTIVGFDPTASDVSVGRTFSVDVTITRAADLMHSSSTSRSILVVQVNSVTEGSFRAGWGGSLVPALSTIWDPGTIDNVAGSVAFVNNVLLGGIPPGAGAAGSGVLVALDLRDHRVDDRPECRQCTRPRTSRMTTRPT